jgi:hypothetical protein
MIESSSEVMSNSVVSIAFDVKVVTGVVRTNNVFHFIPLFEFEIVKSDNIIDNTLVL